MADWMTLPQWSEAATPKGETTLLSGKMFNEDGLGCAFDALYDAGLGEVFAHVASHELNQYGIKHNLIHVGIGFLHVHGGYEGKQGFGVIQIEGGYSRVHRPGLQQVIVGLLTTYRCALPTWIEVLSRNCSDAKAIVKMVKAYVQQICEGDMPSLWLRVLCIAKGVLIHCREWNELREFQGGWGW